MSRSITQIPRPVLSSIKTLLSLVSLWVTRRGSAPEASRSSSLPASSARARAKPISSATEPARAAALLGRPWEIEGRVEPGERRGRRLGFPTANLVLDDVLRPRPGVYAVRAGVDLGAATEWRDGVANFGRRPTFAGDDLVLEVHLFDFSGDLYGKHLRVQFIDYLRPERRFDGVDALRLQIAEDSDRARRILAAAAAAPEIRAD